MLKNERYRLFIYYLKRQTVSGYVLFMKNIHVVVLHWIAHDMNVKLRKSCENRLYFERKNQTLFFKVT